MKKLNFAVLLAMLICGGDKCYAHDIEAANADGVIIYYNFTNDKTELEVTYQGSSASSAAYSGKVVIPESVTYEGDAYPVTSIGLYAFQLCDGLTKVTIPNSVTWIQQAAFRGCSGLTEVSIPNSVISINPDAFYECSGLTELTIPNSVTFIGDFTFEGCSGLTELTIPGSVTYIGYSAFARCSGLEKITVESGNPNYDSRESNAIITIKSIWGDDSNTLVVGCKNTIIPNSVTSIGDYAFNGCSGLKELTIPGSVTSIGNAAFSGCNGLTELTIPNSVTSIGDVTFQNCLGLKKLTIGTSVTSIGGWAFYGCSGLTTLYSLNTIPPTAMTSWGYGAFDDSHYTTVDLFVPEEALAAYQTAEVWEDFQKLQGFDPTAIAKVSAAEQIESANGQITVTGLTDGTTVAVYDLSGKQVGTATSKGGQVSISTGMTAGSAAIVKVGERSIKTMMK